MHEHLVIEIVPSGHGWFYGRYDIRVTLQGPPDRERFGIRPQIACASASALTRRAAGRRAMRMAQRLCGPRLRWEGDILATGAWTASDAAVPERVVVH